MMRLRKVLPPTLLAMLLLAACGPPPPAPVANRTVGAGPPPSVYSVRRGDTLYSIAWAYGLDYRQVAAWNGIGAPYTIYPGQKLDLREPAVRRPAPPPRRAEAPAPAAKPPPVRPAPATPPPAKRPTPPAPRPSPPPASRTTAKTDPGAPDETRDVGGVTWRWPVRGRLFRTFSASDPTRKGIDIVGSEGQPVYAASGGKVVYSGDGLVGYGNLIIIKHGNRYLSAYGHNRELLVREGDLVAPGQLIAKMGRVDNDRAMLHFEIRRHGKPIDPLRLLPKG
ncbi:MAG: peptidoglycan DD-metalloendopeptidase family protein [Gammaproteobacteria bacterium]|nr:peptidoglycan DD-metalloendopeptidase family protein [Gammaproteobacteria bacterium]